MCDIWYDVDVNLAEVPVNILPLVDGSDFVTIKGAVVYNEDGLALFWHFVTTAGAFTSTAVTPTDTGGAHDWVDQGTSGMYTIEIPATGGTINNDTEGFGWFTGSATDILPWRSPIFGFRSANTNNAFIDTGLSAAATIDANIVSAAANSIDGAALDADVVAKLFSGAALTESYAADGDAATPAQILYLILQRLMEAVVSGTTMTIKKVDGTTTAATATLNSATAPTSITRAT